MALCPAPCIGKISIRKYNKIIRNITLFLDGQYKALIQRLCDEMYRLSAQSKFEEAARLRNQIQSLSSISMQDEPAAIGAYSESMDLQQALKLNKRPRRIEAFDVSNISGSGATASMVSFYDGKPDKNNYRRFRIKAVSGINDYQMLKEAVGRRYRSLVQKQLPLPDLIIIDGGRGQLNIAAKQLQELNLNLPVASIAKPQRAVKEADFKKADRIFFLKPAGARLANIRTGSGAMLLIQRIRDEAHRFTLAYHHILRRKKTLGR
jgi:excinuclease ABC subunit C